MISSALTPKPKWTAAYINVSHTTLMCPTLPHLTIFQKTCFLWGLLNVKILGLGDLNVQVLYDLQPFLTLTVHLNKTDPFLYL